VGLQNSLDTSTWRWLAAKQTKADRCICFFHVPEAAMPGLREGNMRLYYGLEVILLLEESPVHAKPATK
jgi:hypothetical protein